MGFEEGCKQLTIFGDRIVEELIKVKTTPRTETQKANIKQLRNCIDMLSSISAHLDCPNKDHQLATFTHAQGIIDSRLKEVV